MIKSEIRESAKKLSRHRLASSRQKSDLKTLFSYNFLQGHEINSISFISQNLINYIKYTLIGSKAK
jgi:hypothetical protein